MKFDFCIGNPPYQDNSIGDNNTYLPPVYDKFLESAFDIADKVEMVHPARFLFNAGSTSKAWNEKMLNDEHFKVLEYEANSGKVFANTDIKGGIAITYRDANRDFGKIGVFVANSMTNSILHKVVDAIGFESIRDLVVNSYSYHLTEYVHIDFPNIKVSTITVNGKEQPLLSKGHEYDLKSNIFDRLPDVFLREKPNDTDDYIMILGRQNNERVYRFIKRKYINDVKNLDKYKVVIPSANGNGAIGNLGNPQIEKPGIGTTETFLSIGVFDSIDEAKAMLNYLKTKFVRFLIGTIKITQHITPSVFQYVPKYNWASNKDIDWSVSVSNIDKQLYKKYGFSNDEISFIESHVKEME